MRAALLLLAGLCCCERESADAAPLVEASAVDSHAIPPPRIELAGCQHVVDTTCHLPADQSTRLQLWIDVHARTRLRVEVDGEQVELEPSAIDGGQRLVISIPAQAERLEITGVDPSWTRGFSLELVRDPVPIAVVAAQRKIDADDFEGARAELEAGLASLDGVERLAALQLLRKVLGEWDSEALTRTEQAAELAEQLGRTRDFADAAAQAAYIHLTVRGDLLAAREWTRRLEAKAAESDEARVLAHYYRGVLESRSGDLTSSLRSLDEAHRGARRLGMIDYWVAASQLLGQGFAELGRGPEALAIIEDTLVLARSPEVSCHERALVLGNVAWAHMLLDQAGLDHDPPAPLLEEQLAMVDERGSCPDEVTATYARVNLALAALADDEPEEAWQVLGQLLAHELPDYLEPWVDEIAAQVGWSTGRWQLVPPVVAQPDPGGEPGLRFSAVVRHARMLERLGLREAAIEGFMAAEAILEATLETVGVEVGRELFLAGRLASAQGLVDLLVGEGRVEDALCRARLARGRALRSLDRVARIAALSDAELTRHEQLLFAYLGLRDRIEAERRDDWSFSAAEREQREGRRGEQLLEAEALLDEALRLVGRGRERAPTHAGGHVAGSCESLPSLAEGEVMLMQFPSATGSWIFIADHTGVSVSAAPGPSRFEDWTSAALSHASERIAAATRIRVLPTGAGWSIPFHALPFAEGVLLDVAPVVYSLDLADRRAPQREWSSSAALVIADPSEDLPYARREAELVSQALSERGFLVERREGAEATRAALAERLGSVALLHYAGHGLHTGAGGWQAALLLHEGEKLGVSDILALPRVPEGVVLTGCDTATAIIDTLDGGMNLGRAFVLAGARWVVAAEGKVDDALAQRIGEALYRRELAAPAAFDGSQALREVQLEMRRDQPTGDWHAFRVLVP